MGKNLEIKIRLDSHKDILNILSKIGAKFSGILNQRDVYYKIAGGLLKLRIENNNCSLIKYNRDESGNDRWSDYEILKLEGENIEKYISSLFEIETVVEKERLLYMFKDTRIHLDTVKDLGKFIELETVVTTDLERAKNLFDEMLALLKLNTDDQLLRSYRDLMLKK